MSRSLLCAAVALLLGSVHGFLPAGRRVLPGRFPGWTASSRGLPSFATVETPVAAVDPSRVFVLPDADAVAEEVFRRIDQAAEEAIAERGHFALAIPGGSVLKMLEGRVPSWKDKCILAYVNHKCVAMDDVKLATHAKAMKLFLKDWDGVSALVLSGSSDSAQEAWLYQTKLSLQPETVLPKDESGLPQFDMVVLGVGDDGHVGSLYPGRDEPLETGTEDWILPVDMKSPGSITFTLPLMNAGKHVLVAACGVSEKYPMGKSDAMKRGIEGAESITSFPGVGVRASADWVIDEAAASKLSEDYSSRATVREKTSTVVEEPGPAKKAEVEEPSKPVAKKEPGPAKKAEAKKTNKPATKEDSGPSKAAKEAKTKKNSKPVVKEEPGPVDQLEKTRELVLKGRRRRR